MRGVGKSTLGRAAAKVLGIAFRESDEELERELASPLPDWILQHGEPAFRIKELQQLRRLLQKPALIGTGGGFVEHAESRALVQSASCLRVYIKAEPEQIWSRIAGDPERRKVGKLDDFASFLALYQRRAGFYEAMADQVLTNDQAGPETAEQHLIILARKFWGL